MLPCMPLRAAHVADAAMPVPYLRWILHVLAIGQFKRTLYPLNEYGHEDKIWLARYSHRSYCCM